MLLGFGGGFERSTDAELSFGGEGTLDASKPTVHTNGFHEIAFLLSDLGHEEEGVTDEGAVREAALKLDALGGGTVEVVHGVVDFPRLNVGALKETGIHRT